MAGVPRLLDERMHSAWLRAGVAICVLAAAAVLARGQAVEFSAAERKAMDACVRLGLTKHVKRPLVSTETFGGFSQGERYLRRGWGFLLKRTADKVVLSTHGWNRRSVIPTTSPRASGEAIVRPTTVDEVVGLAAKRDDLADWFWKTPPLDCNASIRLTLAAQCRALGRADAARRVLDQIESSQQTPGEATEPLARALSRLGERMHIRQLLAFEDAAVPRSVLLKKFEVWSDVFGEAVASKYAVEARDLQAGLREQIAEDRERADRSTSRTLPMKDADTAELIWRLRDANANPLLLNVWCSVLMTRGKKRNAGHELVRRGWAALPELIEALDDRRPTRTLGFSRGSDSPRFVIRVGDAALTVIREIVDESAWTGRSRVGARRSREDSEVAKAQIRAWWRDSGSLGEIAHLTRMLETPGGVGRRQLMERLFALDPQRAVPLVRATIRESIHVGARTHVLSLLATVPGEEAEQFLRSYWELQHPLRLRLTAGVALAERDAAGFPAALESLWPQVVKSDEDLGDQTIASLAEQLFRNGAKSRERVGADALEQGSHIRRSVSRAWRDLFADLKPAELSGSARTLASDMALDSLSIGVIELMNEGRYSGHWRRLEAATLLARWRRVPLDADASPIRRIEAMRALASAERADRDEDPLPVSQVLARADNSSAASARAVKRVELSAASEAPLPPSVLKLAKGLVGTVPDAAALEAVTRALFVARTEYMGRAVVRLRRIDGVTTVQLALRSNRYREGWTLKIDDHAGDPKTYSSDFFRADAPDDHEFPAHLRRLIRRRLAQFAKTDTFLLDISLKGAPG